ncbi:MAG: hypothetical protein H0T56_03230 [Pseudaminobacter sp.]|nr:hypothetical protein [Pseudaminobacter sp.]
MYITKRQPALPAPSQAQKHVTHNEALRMHEPLVQGLLVDRDLGVPPATPKTASATSSPSRHLNLLRE